MSPKNINLTDVIMRPWLSMFVPNDKPLVILTENDSEQAKKVHPASLFIFEHRINRIKYQSVLYNSMPCTLHSSLKYQAKSW